MNRAVARIGIDLDNTLAGYDRAFAEAAREAGLLAEDFAGGKEAVRAAVRALPDGETAWQALQGRVYGARMDDAEPVAGTAEFLLGCRAAGVTVLIVSHRTLHGHFDPARVDLHAAARRWLAARGYFDRRPGGLGLDEASVHFETTRQAKLARIGALGLDHFIDDLPDVLTDPSFPPGPSRWLYDPRGAAPAGPYRRFGDWSRLFAEMFRVAA